MWFVYHDASALVKRYSVEPGTPVINRLFHHVPQDRMTVLSVGYAEVVAVLVRKHNAGVILAARLPQLIRDVRAEVGPLSPVRMADVHGALADRAFDLMELYSINATDAILLRSALDLAASLRARGDDLLLVTCDRRLLNAANKEGLTTFNPETQSESELNTILGP